VPAVRWAETLMLSWNVAAAGVLAALAPLPRRAGGWRRRRRGVPWR